MAEDAGAPEVRVSGLPQTCTRPAKVTAPVTTCNGAAELCDRTYDKVVTPTAHNAMSNADDGWSVPNQTHGMRRALDDGIRGLLIDLHYYDTATDRNSSDPIPEATTIDQVYFCHTLCALGKKRGLDGLCDITAFLDTHPGEVVSIVFETYVTDRDLVAVLDAAGLTEYAYTHPKGAPWPTLRDLITSNKRLVVFVETGGGDPPWLMPAFVGNIRDTPYTFEQESDFTCKLNRGANGDPLFLINHWLARPSANIDLAREANAEAVLGKRVTDCTTEVAQTPTFVAVDFYDVGDLFTVVRKANGL